MPDNATVGYEQDLNNIVIEYLEYADYTATSTAFKEECVSKSRPTPQTSGIKSDQKKQEIQRDLLNLFHDGERREFFILWNESLPQVTRDRDKLCQKLEFYLQIYFAIYHVKYPHPSNQSNGKLEENMAAFRTFLETRGADLSQTTEFLPYYALPFVPNPATHPSFKELFSESWVPDLQLRLEKFLAISLRTNASPSLLELYRDGSKEVQLQLTQTQQSLIDTERRLTRYMRRYSKMQSDYHNIISITAELVDTLEATFNGTMVTPEYLQSVCARLFSNQAGQSVDLTRPGTAGSAIRKSLVANHPAATDPQSSPRASLDGGLPSPPSIKPHGSLKDIANSDRRVPYESAAISNVGASVDNQHQQNSSNHPRPEDSSSVAVVLYPPLDYTRVKEDITYAEDRQRCLLLQALRWRLTKSVPGDQRDDVIRAYVKNDLLACDMNPSISYPHPADSLSPAGELAVASTGDESSVYREAVFRLLKSRTLSAQYLARLFNGMSSVKEGRTYLSLSSELLNEMQLAMKAEARDSLTREMLLGALQKLSLKRSLQTMMISAGLIDWLVEELQESDSLTDYSLEYSVALLMNLCLRTGGKLRTANFTSKILSVLTDLLGHENHDIRPYINGTLYSILCVPEIKHEAKSMGLEDIMTQYKSPENPEMNRQIDFIIRQLNSEEKPKDPNDSGDEEEEEEEEEEGDAMEADLDKDEIVRAETSELSGEKLLTSKYLAAGSDGDAGHPPKTAALKSRNLEPDAPLMRPTTPGRTHAAKNQAEKDVAGNGYYPSGAPVSRPTTSGGAGGGAVSYMDASEIELPLREVSSDSVKTDTEASEALGKTLGLSEVKVVKTARSQSGVAPSRHAIEKLENIDYNEYSMVFGSRPKIVRTPDIGGPNSGRRNNTAPMAPKTSTSVPKWTHRPNSGGGASVPGSTSFSRN